MGDGHCPSCGVAIPDGTAHACRVLSETSVDRPGRRKDRPVRAAATATATAAAAAPAEAEAPEAPSDPKDAYLGRTLGGQYLVQEKIGAGGMGTVYLCEHVTLKKQFAAKVLLGDAAKKPDLVARFEQEALSASKLDHDNIVDIANFGREPDGTVYIIMELLRGEDLGHVLSRGHVTIDDAIRIAVSICHAMSAAHHAGIVHRDLKPENVFLARRGGGRTVVKLLDFGVSLMRESQLANARLTQTGQVLGSPLYMSPEASRGEADIDARADIYAVGVMLFEMCTGMAPFVADNYLQVLQMHINEPPRAPRELRPDLPEPLEDAILTAMAKGRDERFHTMDDLAAALEAIRPGLDLAAIQDLPAADAGPARGAAPRQLSLDARPSSARRAPPSRGVRRSPLWMVLGTIVAGGLIAAAIYVPRGGAPPAPPPPPPLVPPPPPPMPVVAPDPPARDLKLAIDSAPPGAKVLLDGSFIGETPLTRRVPRDGGSHTLKLELDGHEAKTEMFTAEGDLSLKLELRRAAVAPPPPPATKPKGHGPKPKGPPTKGGSTPELKENR